MLFVHNSGDRQRTEAGSVNELDLLARCEDPSSGWRAVDESNTHTDGDGRLVKHRPARPPAVVEPVAEEEVSDG